MRQLLSPSREGGNRLRLARLSLGNMLVWQVLFSLLMMTVVKCFLTDILRLFGATDELIAPCVIRGFLIYGNLAYMLVTGVLAVIRNDSRPVLSMWLMVGGLLLNIVMDYVFIFPLGGGVTGAAIYHVTAQMLIAVAGLAYFFTRKTALRFDLQMFKLKPKYLKNIVVSGFPSLGNQLSIIAMLFSMVSGVEIRTGGRAGRLYLYRRGQIARFAFDDRAGTRVQPLVAYLYGGGRHRRQNIIGNMGYYTAFGLGIVLMCVSVVGHDVFPTWFNLHGNAAVLATDWLSVRRRSCCWEYPGGRLLLSGDRQNPRILHC